MAPGPKRSTPTISKSKSTKTKSTNPSKSKTISKSTSTSKAKGKRPSTTSTLSSTANSPSAVSNSPIPSALDSPIPSDLSDNPSPSPESDFILAEITPEDSTPKIPSDLILRLLQHSFQDKGKTKINKEVAGVMGKYVEVFVREALARCAFSRGEREREGLDGELGGLGSADGFLEVEDLERVGGQIVLDF